MADVATNACLHLFMERENFLIELNRQHEV